MYKFSRYIILFSVVVLAAGGCLDNFNPPATKGDIKLLVINSFLNATDNSCTVSITRTVPLNGSNQVPKVYDATVTLEEKDGPTFTFDHDSSSYFMSNLPLNKDKEYRLKIVVGKDEYVSTFVNIIQTPPIDSVTFSSERQGVQIVANTHDDNNNTHYYLWKYQETWEYNSAYGTSLKNDNGTVVERPLDEYVYICYQTMPSSDILIASSTKLQQDIISNASIALVPWTSFKLSRKYSILVEQHALDKNAYAYWEQLKKNTESLGTLFDPLPARVVGNFQCTTNPNDMPLGYFSASTVQTKRIFIKNTEVNRQGTIISPYQSCQLDSALFSKGGIGSNVPVNGIYAGIVLIGYVTASSSCVDCRDLGGTTVKPDFWQ